MKALIFTICFSLFHFHPFHVSVTEITYDQGSRQLEISIRLFADDIEKKLGITLNELSHNNNNLKEYILSNFSIQVDGKVAPLEYLGYELEDEIVWCYIKSPFSSVLKNIEVQNTIFFQYFSDQTNIVHVNSNEEIKTLRLSSNNTKGTLIF